MTCAIMQPTYLPWLGYFDMIDQVDTFVFLTNVQLVKRSWQVRNRIKTQQGELFLTIPIKNLITSRPIIKEAIISYEENWIKKHLNSIHYAYQKSDYFDVVFDWFADLLNQKYQSLSELNKKIISDICAKIGIKTNFLDASDLNDLDGSKDELLANICKKIGADTYLSAFGSANYIEEKSPGGSFIQNDIKLFYHRYTHPTYKQLGKDFLPFLCVLDLLFNEGFEKSLKIIKSGRGENVSYLEMSKSN